MTYHSIKRSDDVQFLSDFQSGTDDPIHWSNPNQYKREIVRGGKAAIAFEQQVYYWSKTKGWYLVTNTKRIAWKAFSLESTTNNTRGWMDSCGLKTAEASNILDIRLIKRIQGNSVNPAMFLKELDGNFSTFTKRVSQAASFLSNLKNPKKLAQLTLRYFKGSETRRSLTKRYARAKRSHLRRAKRWGTKPWSDSYLEYQFGWRPMCEDVYNLVGLARETKIKSAQQSAKVGLQPQTYRGSRMKAGPIGRDTDVAECEVLTAGHASIVFEIIHPWLRQGASLESPAYALWDSIPYSWLVDCVVNVGQHLKYIMYDAGLTFRSGYRSVLRRVTGLLSIDESTKISGDGVTNRSESRYYIASGKISYTGISCLRHVYPRFPAIPWFSKVENTMQNTELLSIIAAFVHQQIADFSDKRRSWKPMSP